MLRNWNFFFFLQRYYRISYFNLIQHSTMNSNNSFFFSEIYISMNYYINSLQLYLISSYLLEQQSKKIGAASLPRKYKTFTVLRSPHTDKRSREQFCLIEYKYKYSFPLYLCSSNMSYISSYVPFLGLKAQLNNVLFL